MDAFEHQVLSAPPLEPRLDAGLTTVLSQKFKFYVENVANLPYPGVSGVLPHNLEVKIVYTYHGAGGNIAYPPIPLGSKTGSPRHRYFVVISAQPYDPRPRGGVTLYDRMLAQFYLDVKHDEATAVSARPMLLVSGLALTADRELRDHPSYIPAAEKVAWTYVNKSICAILYLLERDAALMRINFTACREIYIRITPKKPYAVESRLRGMAYMQSMKTLREHFYNNPRLLESLERFTTVDSIYRSSATMENIMAYHETKQIIEHFVPRGFELVQDPERTEDISLVAGLDEFRQRCGEYLDHVERRL